jgi:sugar phosphate isomerase/epimerase
MIDRRSLLGVLAGSFVAGATRESAAGTRRLGDLGVQLFTVRNELRRDFEGTLGKIAALGYREVEFVDLFDRTPAAVRAMLDRHGLVAPSSHVGHDALDRGLAQALEAAKILGQSHIVCAWIDPELRSQPDIWKRAAERFNRAGEAGKQLDIQFAYHNHDFEFTSVGGRLPYDILLAETDPQLVKMEMDLYWITKGGQDPVEYFDRHPGRFPLVHVKDMDRTGEIADIGSGRIDFARIFARSQTAGIRHYLVEHDNAAAPIDSIAASYRFLRQLRF